MKKKHLIIVGTIIISAIVILGLYQTFALSGDITKIQVVIIMLP